MATFSIWAGNESGITLKLGAEKPTHPGDEDAELVKVFEAATWTEATQIRNDHYGWGPYKPFDESEDVRLDDH